MLAGSIPDKVNFTVLIENGTTLQGTIALQKFSRFVQLVQVKEGLVDISLGVQTGSKQRPVIVGSATVTIQLVCQNCLESMDYVVNADVRTTLVEDNASLDSLTSVEDGMVVTSPFVSMIDTFEDELILGLPMVPRHEPMSCISETVDESAELTQRPFADLSKLIKQ